MNAHKFRQIRLLGRLRAFQPLQFFAGLEAHGLTGRDAYLCPSPGIAADTGLPGFYGEYAKPAKLDPLAGNQRLLHAIEDSVDGGLRLGPWQSGSLYNSLDKILLDQDGSAFPST